MYRCDRRTIIDLLAEAMTEKRKRYNYPCYVCQHSERETIEAGHLNEGIGARVWYDTLKRLNRLESIPSEDHIGRHFKKRHHERPQEA